MTSPVVGGSPCQIEINDWHASLLTKVGDKKVAQRYAAVLRHAISSGRIPQSSTSCTMPSLVQLQRPKRAFRGLTGTPAAPSGKKSLPIREMLLIGELVLADGVVKVEPGARKRFALVVPSDPPLTVFLSSRMPRV